MNIQQQEHNDFIYSTDSEWDRAEALQLSDQNTDKKDELYDLVDELNLNGQVQGQGEWARLAGGKNIRLEAQDILADDIIPELNGMGIRDAIYLLENKGMIVRYNGIGRVTGQSIKSGGRIEKGKTIHLTLG